MKAVSGTVLPFPCSTSSLGRRALRKELLNALRASKSPVIVDFSNCQSLDHEDIDLLLECVAQVVGRDMQVLFVAGSRVNRVLLEVTRISSIVPVFDSLEEARAYPQSVAEHDSEDQPGSPSQGIGSA
jgi:STAS domain-containing protein